MKAHCLPALTVTLLVAALTARAAEGARLKPGDTAPALKTAAWIKGDPIEKFTPGKVYVVEFWATRWGPSRTSIPQVTELAKKFKGKAEFIGVNVCETEPDPAKIKANVSKFVDEMGAKMDYRVALDTADTFMVTAWLKASGRGSVPSVFVVDQGGKIAWIGHPLDNLEPILADVVAGKFDAQATADKEVQKQAAQRAEQEMARAISRLRAQGKFAEALAEFDSAAKQNPELAKRGAMMRVSLLLESDRAAGLQEIKTLSAGEFKDNPRALMNLARMVGGPQTKQPDHDLALSLAQQALKAAKEPDAMLLISLAEIYTAKGDKEKAITTTKEAIAVAEKDPALPPAYVKGLKTRLATLESGK